jgi:hypothetical protein
MYIPKRKDWSLNKLILFQPKQLTQNYEKILENLTNKFTSIGNSYQNWYLSFFIIELETSPMLISVQLGTIFVVTTFIVTSQV